MYGSDAAYGCGLERCNVTSPQKEDGARRNPRRRGGSAAADPGESELQATLAGGVGQRLD